MKELLIQYDNICEECEEELPRGSWVWLDNYDRIICDSCKSKEEDMIDLNKL